MTPMDWRKTMSDLNAEENDLRQDILSLGADEVSITSSLGVPGYTCKVFKNGHTVGQGAADTKKDALLNAHRAFTTFLSAGG